MAPREDTPRSFSLALPWGATQTSRRTPAAIGRGPRFGRTPAEASVYNGVLCVYTSRYILDRYKVINA